MIRAAIVGASGYAGAELVRILSGHPDVSLTTVTSRQYAGQAFTSIYPALNGLVQLSCEENDPKIICDRSDVVFLALPHKVSMSMVPDLLSEGKRVVDLSADFRFSDQTAYEAHYQPIVVPIFWVRQSMDFVSGTQRDPGRKPHRQSRMLSHLRTAALASIGKGGVGGFLVGGGRLQIRRERRRRAATATTHFCQVNESFKAYKVGSHRHTPEMEEIFPRRPARRLRSPSSLTCFPLPGEWKARRT